MSVTEFEKRRLENIEDNARLMEELGLSSLVPDLEVLNASVSKAAARKRKQGNMVDLMSKRSPMLTRSVSRVSNHPKFQLSSSSVPNDHENVQENSQSLPRENSFGEILGVPVGTTFVTRLECSRVGIHRPTVAGIHGSVTEGCFSLALSGGYEDDVDNGLTFTYTGAGGRDLKGTKTKPKNLRTAPQSKDQTLTGTNLALSLNIDNKHPVRVVRGYKLQGPYAPDHGYRYDGLYQVEKMWKATGNSGYTVYKYHLKRLENQDPPPWENTEKKEE